MSLHSPGATAVALHKDRHIRYWLRCLRTLLPTAYTSNDTIRLTLAYFTLSALDVLCGLETQTTGFERADFAEWIYHCQHPAGGFRGSPATYLGDEASPDATTWDPPNLPATFFAIAALIVLGDDLKRLQRRKCLEVLPKFQRQNGSFGEVLGEGGNPDGGTSMRFAYFAAVLRWILRSGRGQQDDDVEDVDVDALLGFIGSARASDLLRTKHTRRG
ncbi:MAG: hypothetical protein M1825_000290 [Sarcosagium campestre]|nr:MAG: hypothetical protein M1825_000290 [Sarcosagium campestre]